jgi:hypothetical protein
MVCCLQAVFPTLQAGNYLVWITGCGIWIFFKHSTHEPSSKEQFLTFPHFLGSGLGEKIAVCAHTTRLPKKRKILGIFVNMKRLRTSKNQKPKAVNVLSEAYPMVPLTCRSNLA